MYGLVLNSIIGLISGASRSNSLSVLTYHRVGESYNQLFMDEVLFEQQLVWIKRYFNPVGLAEGIKLQQQGKLPNRAVAITIDDGYVDSFTTIFPLLQKHKLTATFFISTSGLTKGYLWDELICSAILQLPINMKELDFEGNRFSLTTYNQRLNALKEIINKIKYSSLVERERLIQQLMLQTGLPELPSQFLDEAQIISLYQSGMEIGAHTVNHPILSCENITIAKQEILESKQQLEKIIQAPVNFLAYPNGKKNIDFDQSHENLAKECGFEAAFSTDWGSINASNSNHFSLQRFTPWDSTEGKFSLRLALNGNKRFKRLFIK